MDTFTLHGVDILGYLIETESVSSDVSKPVVTHDLQNSSNIINGTNCVEYQICVSAETAAGVGDQTCILRSRIAGGVLNDACIYSPRYIGMLFCSKYILQCSVHVCVCVCVCVHVCVCMYVYMCVCVCVFVCVIAFMQNFCTMLVFCHPWLGFVKSWDH